MQDLRITLIQSMLHWEDADANRSMFAERMAELRNTTDLLVLPEMFTTGFTMRSTEQAETMEGPTVAWLRQQAAHLNASIYGSVIIEEGGSYYNRGLFVRPDGALTCYDKRHLFRMADEQKHFAAGRERVVVEWRGWRILLQVCYDLRFPVFSRNKNDYDLALYVANWPEPRRHPWTSLLVARAIENQCYVAGVNRVGMDGKGIHYSGDTAALDPKGEPVLQLAPHKEGVDSVVLSGSELEEFRKRFPVGLDADAFHIELS